MSAPSAPPTPTAPSWRSSPTRTTLAPAIRASSSRKADIPVAGHARLVEDQDMARGERQPVVLELPAQRGQGLGRGDARLPAQGAGRLAGGRGADDPIPTGLEGVTDGGHDCRLARSGHALDQLHAPARRGDPLDRRHLPVGQRSTEGLALPGKGRVHHLGCHLRGVDARHPSGHRLFDGLFRGQHGGRRIGPLGGPGHTDQGDGRRVTQHPGHHPVQLGGRQAVEMGGDSDDHVALREHLAIGQRATRPEDLCRQGGQLPRRQAADRRPRSAGSPARPARSGPIALPAGSRRQPVRPATSGSWPQPSCGASGPGCHGRPPGGPGRWKSPARGRPG